MFVLVALYQPGQPCWSTAAMLVTLDSLLASKHSLTNTLLTYGGNRLNSSCEHLVDQVVVECDTPWVDSCACLPLWQYARPGYREPEAGSNSRNIHSIAQFSGGLLWGFMCQQ